MFHKTGALDSYHGVQMLAMDDGPEKIDKWSDKYNKDIYTSVVNYKHFICATNIVFAFMSHNSIV